MIEQYALPLRRLSEAALKAIQRDGFLSRPAFSDPAVASCEDAART